MDKGKVKVAVIGCGYWGRNHVRVFERLGVLAAICDESPERLAEMRATYTQVQEKTFSEILLDNTINAVVIATPAVSHFDLAFSALAANKHVFVEKPVALKIEDAQKLCEFSAKQGRLLMVGHLLHYHPGFVMLKQMIRRGEVGELKYLYSNRLNFGKVRHQENILWSFAPHDISMILALVGHEPLMVASYGASYLNQNIKDMTMTHMEFPGGIRSHIFVSWLHPYKEQKLIVLGEHGMIVFDDGQDWSSKLQIFRGHIDRSSDRAQLKRVEAERIDLLPQEPLQQECEHFLECIRQGRRPLTDGEEGLRVLKVLNAAELSYTNEQSPIQVPSYA